MSTCMPSLCSTYVGTCYQSSSKLQAARNTAFSELQWQSVFLIAVPMCDEGTEDACKVRVVLSHGGRWTTCRLLQSILVFACSAGMRSSWTRSSIRRPQNLACESKRRILLAQSSKRRSCPRPTRAAAQFLLSGSSWACTMRRSFKPSQSARSCAASPSAESGAQSY